MAKIHGELGSADLAATTNTELYKVPSNKRATGVLTLCNRGAADVTVRYAHVPGGIGALAEKNWRWYDVTVSKFIEKTGIPLAANAAIVVWASAAGVSASIEGIEEDV